MYGVVLVIAGLTTPKRAGHCLMQWHFTLECGFCNVRQYTTQFTSFFPHSLMYVQITHGCLLFYLRIPSVSLQWLFQQLMDLSLVNRSVHLIKLVQKANFSYKLFVLSIYGIYPSFHQMREVWGVLVAFTSCTNHKRLLISNPNTEANMYIL